MISVLGSGAFGTALAVSLAGNGPVTLWARNADHAQEMATMRRNTRRLPDVTLPDRLSVTASLPEALAPNAPCLLSVPTQKLRQLLTDHGDVLSGRQLVACCKGIELTTGLSPVSIIGDVLPDATAAILTGPSFAADIARGLPTALTLACADDDVGKYLQNQLTTANLRLYRTTDTAGAELGGALKNVMAIACGAVMGAGLGESARAALMTRGFTEMQRMAVALGARADTLAGLSGFGDLTLTCTSAQSRNYQFGLSLGQRAVFDPSITVEGAATARAAQARARTLGIDMPITEMTVNLIDGKLHVSQAMDMLLSRPLKEE